MGLGILEYGYYQTYFLSAGAINKSISLLCRKALKSLSLDFAFSFKDWLPGFKCAPEQAPEIHQIPAGVPGTGVLPELLSLLPATLHISTGHCSFSGCQGCSASLDFSAFQQEF